MALNYIVRKGKDLINPTNVVYQGRVKIKDYKDTMSLAEMISDQASATVADVYGVLASLVQVMKSYVMDGNIVQFGDFGTFRATIKSKTAETKDLWMPKENIKGLDIIFTPGAQLRRAYALAQFKSAESALGQGDGDGVDGVIPNPGE